MTTRHLALLAVGLGLSACDSDIPEDPSWTADVRPILLANCVRCHNATPDNDAPSTFRLDVYDDLDGMRGAATMAEFIAARTRAMGDMPPEGPGLTVRQQEILWAWQYTIKDARRPNNSPPELDLMVGDDQGDTATIHAVVTDADGDMVRGYLKIDGTDVAVLREGARDLVVDTSGLAAGERMMTAVLDDGDGTVNFELGTLTVSHDNAVPNVTITSPARDELVVAGEPLTVVLTARDADARSETLSVEVKAVRGDEVVSIASGAHPEISGNLTLSFDTAGMAEGDDWHIEATVSDGKSSRTASSVDFIVSHGTTTETYASLRELIDETCAGCHPLHMSSGPKFNAYDDLRKYRGRAWRKVLQRREMPPKSVKVVYPGVSLSDADRERLGAWFYAGAPE